MKYDVKYVLQTYKIGQPFTIQIDMTESNFTCYFNQKKVNLLKMHLKICFTLNMGIMTG